MTGLGTWRHLEGLRELADVIAVTRAGFELADLAPSASWPRVHVMEMPRVDVSSTEIRERVRRGRPIDYLVPADVASFIWHRGLYMERRGAPPGETA